ncbi:MAG: hypothetical protein IJU23_08650 [Proteobacteria bacterium]|nr:hypothetical protein [Pseudomonadota bacterium]
MAADMDIRAGLLVPAGEGEETAEIYRREARAVYETDREAAAALLLDAAYANDRDDNPVESIVRDLRLATALCPHLLWVHTAAHRLLLKLGLWRDALSLLERELSLLITPDQTIAISLTASDLYWLVADDRASAMNCVRKSLAIDSTCTGALYNGLWIGNIEEQREFAESLARILGAPSERSVLYGLAGSILASRGNEAKALECYANASQADKTNPYVLLHHAILNERFEKLPEAAQAYAQIAQIFEDPAISGEFFRRAGTILGYISAPEKSGFLLCEALKKVEDKFSVTWAACESFHRIGNAQKCLELERMLIEMAPDTETKAAHLLSFSDLCLNELNEPELAIDALEKTAASGLYTNLANTRLAAVYESRGEWDKLAAVLARMEQTSIWDKSCLLWLLGDALWRSDARDEAIEVFSKIQTTIGHFRLDHAFEQTGNHEAHARMLENWLQTTTDAGTHDAILSQLLTILTERLHAPEIAIQYLKETGMTQFSRDIAWKKLHLSMELQRYDDAVAGLMRLNAETTDRDEALMWAMEAALIEDRELHNVDAAVEILRGIHEAAPAFVPAVIYLHHIGLREKNHDIVMLANTWREAFQMSATKRAETACENALSCLNNRDIDSAVLWFEKARKLAPLSPYHLRIYIDLLKSASRWQDAVKIIQDSIDTALQNARKSALDSSHLDDDTDENAILPDMELAAAQAEASLSVEQNTLRQMMLDIQSFCLHHAPGTIAGRQKLFELRPSISTAISWFFDKAAVEAPSELPNTLAAIRTKLTSVSEEMKSLFDWCAAELIRLQCPDGADAPSASAILTLLKKSLDLRYGSCLRAEVLRTLREIPNEDITSWLERYAALTPDKWMNSALSREAALRAIWIEEDFDTARSLSQSLSRDATDRRTLWMLEQFSAVSEDWKALGVFREKLAQFESSAQSRLQILKSALAPYVDEGLTEHAVRVAQECLKLDGHAFPALVTLAHVAEDSEDLHSLACIADRLSEASACSDNRTEYGLWAAQIWSKSLSRPEQAIAGLGRLLAQEPACMPAISMSEILYNQLEKYDQLGRIYASAIAALPEGEIQCTLLRKQAVLLAEKLSDAPSACLSLNRIIAQNPSDVEALSMLSELLISQERWGEAVDIIEQLSKVVDSPQQKREANLRLANILVHQLEQPERARRILRKHLVQFEHDMPALQLLYDIACSERNWNDAKTTLEEIGQAEGTVEARHAKLAFTRVAREAGWSHDFRTLYEREAIAAVIGHREDFDVLVEDYRAHNEINRLIDVAKRELGQLGNVEQIALYRGCIAALLVANRQNNEALVFLSEIIHDSQNTDWAYLARAQALTSDGKLESAVGEFRRTLTRNIHLDDAMTPFIEVLKQTGDEITLASVVALRKLRQKSDFDTPWTRCVKGAPRGYFDVDHMPLARALIDAQRYLRTMTPYAFELFSDNISISPLPDSHWCFGRCHRLFGQNFELKQAFVTRGLKNTLCRVKLQTEPALIFDESILDENEPVVFDFWAAYAMHQAVSGGCVIDVLSDSSVDALFSALCQAKPESALAQTMKKQLFKALPRAERKLFKDGVPFLAPVWSDFRRALQTRASCVAAVVSASPAYALATHPDDEALQVFLISEGYVRAVKTYWTQGLGITA